MSPLWILALQALISVLGSLLLLVLLPGAAHARAMAARREAA